MIDGERAFVVQIATDEDGRRTVERKDLPEDTRPGFLAILTGDLEAASDLTILETLRDLEAELRLRLGPDELVRRGIWVDPSKPRHGRKW